MQVTIVFEFPEINNPSSPPADDIVNLLTQSTVEWQEWLRELTKNENVNVWVDDATQTTKEN